MTIIMETIDETLSFTPPASPRLANEPDPFAPKAPRKTRTGFSEASSVLEPQWEKQCILSLDGGGIRGYSTLLILRNLMLLVAQKEKSENPQTLSSFHPLDPAEDGIDTGQNRRKCKFYPCVCQFKPCHYFDYVGGTSTGGLISIMLGRLRMGIDEALTEYEKFGGDIFGHPRLASIRGPILFPREKYNSKRLQRVIKEVVNRNLPEQQRLLGAGNFRSDQDLCKTVVVAYEQRDEEGVAIDDGPYLFRSYPHYGSKLPGKDIPDPLVRNPGPAHSIPIWQAARATTAAPTFFHEVEIEGRKFGDGGFGTNNPVEELYFEVSQMHGNDPSNISLLLSVGTGESGVLRFAEGIVGKYYGYIKAAKKLASSSAKAHGTMQKIARAPKFNLPYHRLSVGGSKCAVKLGDMKLDEWKPEGKHGFLKMRRRAENETLRTIECLTQDYCAQEEVRAQLDEIATILVRHRRDRCGDSLKWEFFASGIRYRCPEPHCDKSQKLHPCALSLKKHLIRRHGYKESDGESKKKLQEKIIKGRFHV